jgi:hypothetical protein
MGTSLQLIHDTDTNLNAYTGLMGEVTVSTNDGRPRSSAGIAGGKKLAFLDDFDPQAWQVPSLSLGWIGLGGAWRNPR